MKRYEPPIEERVTVYIQRGTGNLEKVGYIGERAVAMHKAFVDDMPGLTHPNSKAVRVIDVDYAKFEEYALKHDLRPIHKEQVFDSATMASDALGCETNQVAIRLSHARAKAEGEAKAGLHSKESPTATVRGVTFRYLDGR